MCAGSSAKHMEAFVTLRCRKLQQVNRLPSDDLLGEGLQDVWKLRRNLNLHVEALSTRSGRDLTTAQNTFPLS